ncbi:RidA family protein [Streptomyces sp. NPDC001276]|uniref:RidA family protein n=1 Tax=Streptomyces sp. NPDC001276 TaxID=3364555 RepID=UPI0036793090
MTVEHLNPASLAPPNGYSHVTVATGRSLAFISGKIAVDADGALVGAGDYRTQGRVAARNLWLALQAAGGRPDQLARVSIYIVDHTPEREDDVLAGMAEAAVESGIGPTAGILIGVAAVGIPGALVEIEAVAVLD